MGAARYRAFISYSHHDAPFGRRLHGWLEGYRLPARLVGRPGRHGPVPPRLYPVFRDLEEFPASDDLSIEISAALADSACLVVVCSPQAAASRWVAREIEVFRRLHPERPVLAALISGEPADAFPPALIAAGTEPLAADFRPDADAALAKLKLIAGILGIGLEDLVQRDAQRRIARTAVVAGAVVALTAATAAAVVTWDARNRAEQQRAQIERLVDSLLAEQDPMTADGRLRPLGQLALDYYARQDLTRVPAKDLLRRADLLKLAGQDDMRRGDLVGSLAQFQAAYRTTSAVLAAAPGSPERIEAQANSEYWLANALEGNGRLAEAQAAFERQVKLADQRLALAPAGAASLVLAADAESNLGDFLLRVRKDPTTALPHLRRVIETLERAVVAAPADRSIQLRRADEYGHIAECHRMLGDLRAARQAHAVRTEALLALHSQDGAHVGYRHRLLGNAIALALIDMEEGQVAAARGRLEAAHALAAEFESARPRDRLLRLQSSAVDVFLARAILAGPGLHRGERALPYLMDCMNQPWGGELAAICAMTRIQAARATGRRDDAALAFVEVHRRRMTGDLRRNRWGVDLAALLAETERSA